MPTPGGGLERQRRGRLELPPRAAGAESGPREDKVLPRIIVDLPERFLFTTEIPLYIGHINYGHHLDNAALLSLVSEARVRLFKSLGYTELDVEGLGIIVSDAAVQYKSEARHGEVLVFAIAFSDFNKYGCDIVWRAADKESGREVARGKTGIVFFDYSRKRMAPVPPPFRNRAEAAGEV